MKEVLSKKDLNYLAIVNTAAKVKELIIYYRDDEVAKVKTDNVRWLENYIGGKINDAYKRPDDITIRDEDSGLDFTFKTLLDDSPEVHKRIFKE